MNAANPPVAVTAPATSRWRVPSGRLDSDRNANATRAIPAAIGTFTKSTHLQESSDVSTPPRNPPAAPPIPAEALHIPSALTNWGPLKVVTRIVSVAGESTAPPRPWNARAVVSHVDESANPPTRLATAKSTSPERYTRLRP